VLEEMAGDYMQDKIKKLLMSEKYTFTAPGYYRIEVQGGLRAGWSDRFGAMQVLQNSEANQGVSVLRGCVSDQAELSGILNTLYELHMSLLSVQYLGEECPSTDDS
jgi:hypothetical protein